MPPNPGISSRRAPQQARSSTLVAAVLDAAVQVLEREGARRFTMARVAERAGVSVGSLYQYFPNKGAILFRLQSDEWRQTSKLLRDILEDRTMLPGERVRALVHAFLRSECEEATIRIALNDAAPFYRDAPEALELHAESADIVHAFLRESAPRASDAQRAIAGDLIKTTLSEVGKSFSAVLRTPNEIHAYADALADMLGAYLQRLAATAPTT
jgi:AcrR family transcriptional regulator